MGREAKKRHQRQSEAAGEGAAESPSHATQASQRKQLSIKSKKLSRPVTTNTYKILMEIYKTGGTAQIVREFISNSIDSGCSSIKFAPLPYPAHKAGFAVVDDGHGMSRPGNLVRLRNFL